MSDVKERLPDRLLSRVPERYRGQVPPEVPALWEDPKRLRVLMASVVAMFALAIFPPYFSPGAEAIQTTLKDDPASLGLAQVSSASSLRLPNRTFAKRCAQWPRVARPRCRPIASRPCCRASARPWPTA